MTCDYSSPSPTFDFRLFTCDYSPTCNYSSPSPTFDFRLFTCDYSPTCDCSPLFPSVSARISVFGNPWRSSLLPICHAGLRPGIHDFLVTSFANDCDWIATASEASQRRTPLSTCNFSLSTILRLVTILPLPPLLTFDFSLVTTLRLVTVLPCSRLSPRGFPSSEIRGGPVLSPSVMPGYDPASMTSFSILDYD